MTHGSSPHTRGAQLSGLQHLLHERIIPAYAGSTAFARLREAVDEDHPRIRGEHGSSSATIIWSTGSSPHTRGAPGTSDSQRWPARIIPAYAGSTWRGGRRSARRTDHPRIRGEHASPSSRTTTARGSSPHTRGARRPVDAQPGPPGIIPAYAGSTLRRRARLASLRDHPRIRGEH